MSYDDLQKIIVVLIPTIIGAATGYFLKYYLDKRSKFVTKNAEVKREIYQEFIDMTSSFFINSEQEKKMQANFVDNMSKFYKKYVLYGSPKVVRSFSSYTQIFYKRQKMGNQDKEFTKRELKQLIRSITKIYKSMRKDIGLSNRGLGKDGALLLRAVLKDYDDIMRQQPFSLLKSFFKLQSSKSRNVSANDSVLDDYQRIESENDANKVHASESALSPITPVVKKKNKKSIHKRTKR